MPQRTWCSGSDILKIEHYSLLQSLYHTFPRPYLMHLYFFAFTIMYNILLLVVLYMTYQ